VTNIGEKEALSLHVFGMEEDGDDIPEPSPIIEFNMQEESFGNTSRASFGLL
jgi:hypothetical protein